MDDGYPVFDIDTFGKIPKRPCLYKTACCPSCKALMAVEAMSEQRLRYLALTCPKCGCVFNAMM